MTLTRHPQLLHKEAVQKIIDEFNHIARKIFHINTGHEQGLFPTLTGINYGLSIDGTPYYALGIRTQILLRTPDEFSAPRLAEVFDLPIKDVERRLLACGAMVIDTSPVNEHWIMECRSKAIGLYHCQNTEGWTGRVVDQQNQLISDFSGLASRDYGMAWDMVRDLLDSRDRNL